MARIEYKWDEPKLNSYEGFNPESLYSSLPDSYKSAAKPGIVFLTSSLEDHAQYMKNVEATTLMDENVQIGATMFQHVKMNGNKVTETHPYWKILGGKTLPRLVVVDATGAKIGSVEGQDVSASKVFALMKRASARTYKTELEAVVKGTKEILTSIDNIEAKRTALKQRMESSSKPKTEEWAKEQKALDDAMKAVEAREADLVKKWNEERKVAKA